MLATRTQAYVKPTLFQLNSLFFKSGVSCERSNKMDPRLLLHHVIIKYQKYDHVTNLLFGE